MFQMIFFKSHSRGYCCWTIRNETHQLVLPPLLEPQIVGQFVHSQNQAVIHESANAVGTSYDYPPALFSHEIAHYKLDGNGKHAKKRRKRILPVKLQYFRVLLYYYTPTYRVRFLLIRLREPFRMSTLTPELLIVSINLTWVLWRLGIVVGYLDFLRLSRFFHRQFFHFFFRFHLVTYHLGLLLHFKSLLICP